MAGAADEGRYPVTNGLAWHGGMHLVAPGNAEVRAIADGVVAYVRSPTARNTNVDDPLNYQTGAGVSGWTSDGCVIIRHDTEIGNGVSATVRYFSIYMHLEEIPATVIAARAIYRKESLGRAGYINGQTGRIHCEVICDDANLQRLVGRTTGNLALTAHGRVDALYGDIYFALPVGTQIFAAAPATPAAAMPAPAYTTDTALFVGIRYDGDAHLTTYQDNGEVVGTVSVDDDFEYTLNQASKDLCPLSPNAAFELMRYGRVIGTDVLNPANSAHWRRIAYPGGRGYVNLAPDGIRKFSDADFPHWKRWSLVDDSADLDSRMDAAVIRRLLDADGDGIITPEQARAQLGSAAIQTTLQHVICKTPTEWNAATIDARWGWLKTATPEHPDPLEEADFALLKAHISKLCFWAEANLGIDANHWHFNPKEFVGHFRKCAWYSAPEMAQCIPRRSGATTILWATASARATTHKNSLNLFFGKYLGSKRTRHVHALAQVYIETGFLGLNCEGGTGHGKDYGAFYGRGYMQLTWAMNYDAYGKFRGLANQAHPTYADNRITTTSLHMWQAEGENRRWSPRYDPAVVEDLMHGAESSGFFWISKSFAGRKNINRPCDIGVTPAAVGYICWLVNGGGNGYTNRQEYAAFLKNVLLDEVLLSGSAIHRYPALTPALKNVGHYPPGDPPCNQQLTVHYDRQRP